MISLNAISAMTQIQIMYINVFAKFRNCKNVEIQMNSQVGI